MSIEAVVANGGRFTWPADGAEMVLVPAGEFFMGRIAGDIFAPDEERPGRTVRLRAYLIDRDPVTNEQYRRFIAAGGYVDPHWWSPAGWAWRVRSSVAEPMSIVEACFNAPEQPVAGVSWF
ncbi:MAG TPA: SUMF1/EgtB/PvdO family nonheme iron enzyme, partial [Planctomycetota bacterium]|nr:SUMF1/EgtB/PvdO family nonheme iron enzyme [Planctomycetota bacterium]